MRGAFRPWLGERILADDADLLVVDKPSGVAVHGGDARHAADVIGRLREHLALTGRGDYLGVHQRLDLGTSGVLLFVRNPELNAAVGADFEHGRVKKRYLAAVELAPGSTLERRDELVLEHRLEASRDGRVRVTASGGREARAGCRVLERAGGRALVELAPETGRTHQLRVQLAAERAPIAGDRDYGGAPAPRLLLHAASLELPSLARRFDAAPPPVLRRFVHGGVDALGAPDELRRRLADAACRRYPLLAETDALRWVNGAGDELAGVAVDLYGAHATLSVSSDEALERAAEIAEALVEFGADGVYLKQRARADLRRVDHDALAPATPVRGAAAPSELTVREGALRFAVELGGGLSTGLFVDQRDNRARVFATSGEARVLNLFAYTCSFSVAAAVGGARRVTSVDVSRRALARGAENFRRNGVDPGPHAFVQEDVARYLQRAAKRAERFDWIVLDPPSFSSSGSTSGVLRVDRDYARLVELAVRVLAERGRLLAVTNHRGTSRARLRHLVLEATLAAGREAVQAKELASGLDCPDGADGPEPSKAVLLTLK